MNVLFVKEKIKYLLKFIIPYNVVLLWWSWSAKANWSVIEQRLLETGALKEIDNVTTEAFSVSKTINFLVQQGYDRQSIKEGSIPEASLDFCAFFIEDLFFGRPLLGIHVGNFVGVSLGFFVNSVKKLHPESRIVSIDPNIQHRGIKNPLNATMWVLNRFGLENSCMILTGYTLEKNPYYEVSDHSDRLTSSFDVGLSCAYQLKGLEMMASNQFDFLVIDGNHLGSYLRREIESADKLLKTGGLLILDDVTPFWNEIQEVYEAIDRTKYQKLAEDGRVGILKKIA